MGNRLEFGGRRSEKAFSLYVKRLKIFNAHAIQFIADELDIAKMGKVQTPEHPREPAGEGADKQYRKPHLYHPEGGKHDAADDARDRTDPYPNVEDDADGAQKLVVYFEHGLHSS